MKLRISSNTATVILATLNMALSGLISPAQAQVSKVSRFVMGANFGTQTTTNDRRDKVDFELFTETGNFETAQEVRIDTVRDANIAVRLWKRVGAGVAVSRSKTTSKAMINAEVPHPFFFEFPRSSSKNVDGLRHRESMIHLQSQLWVPIGDRLLLTVFLGPSYFEIKQDLVSKIATAERGPSINDVDIIAFTKETVTRGSFGYHLGFDMAYFGLLNQNFLGDIGALDHMGLALMIRYSRASARGRFMDRPQTAIELGGLHVVGGLRLAF